MMLLTENEVTFLTRFIHEATTDPFKGPATNELHCRDIYYTDLSNLMAAYYAENTVGSETAASESSCHDVPCPWADRAAALRRNEEVRVDLQKTAEQTAF